MDNPTVDNQGAVQEPSRGPMPPPPEYNPYDESGKLTREGMIRVIRGGGSVTYGSRNIWREEDLPNEAQMAQGDKVKSAQAAASLQAQRDAIDAQLASLSAPPKDAHPGHAPTQSTSAPVLPGDIAVGTHGEGDTAGADGDAGDPNTPAGVKAAAAAAQAEEDAKAAADAKAKQEEADAKAIAQLEADARASAKSKGEGK